MNFEKTSEIANWLGKTADCIKINRIKQLTDEGRIFITLWGHYSAGKSRLINSILGRDILPVQHRETTAALTYIQYGEKEKCLVHYEDGSFQRFEMDQVKDIFQNTNTMDDVKQIDYIEVFVNDDLLINGLVLVDTPGVNTVIQKHQNIAVDAIEQSGKIVYVLGGSPSNVDKNFVDKINKCGVEIVFVRTKCDLFNASEENSEESLDQEKNTIERILNDDIVFIPVSNEKCSKWYLNVKSIREELSKVSDNIKEEISLSSEEKIKVYLDDYKKELLAEKERLTNIINGNEADIQEQIKECQKELDSLSTVSKDCDKQVLKKVDKAHSEAEIDIDRAINKSINEFNEELMKISNSESAAKDIYELSIQNTVEKIQSILNDYFDNIVKEEQDNLSEIVKKATDQIKAPTYTEVQQENSRMLDVYRSKLIEVKSEIEKTIEEHKRVAVDSEKAQEEFNEDEYEQALEELNRKLSEIPSGMALRLSDNQSIQPSSIFKKVGQTADFALLLLPGDVVVKGVKAVTNTTKIAQLIHKLGKFGDVILKAGNVAAKNAKVIDKARDAAYAANEIFGKRGYSTKKDKEKAKRLIDTTAQKMGDAYDNFKEDKKSGNILDALSVAYWTEKLGANFDSAPKMEIDSVEEENRNMMRKRITTEQQEISEQRIQKKKELGLLSSKEQELVERQKEQSLIYKKIEAEIKKQEDVVLRNSKAEALNNYKVEYKKYFETSVNKVSKEIINDYFNSVSQNITLYVSSQNSKLYSSVNEKKEQLESLVAMKENRNSDLEIRLNTCDSYLNAIEGMM